MTAQLSRERLEKIASWREKFGADHNVMLPAEEAEAMARMLLGGMDNVPVAWTSQRSLDVRDKIVAFTSKESADEYGSKSAWTDIVPLYTAPPAPVAVSDDVFNEAWEQHLAGVMCGDNNKQAALSFLNACRDATLKDGPVTAEYSRLTMTKEQAIKLSRAFYDSRNDESNYDFVNSDSTDSTDSKPVTGWIKCSERMPGIGQQVLATNRKINVFEVAIFDTGSISGKEYFGTSSGKFVATHWMPLPAAPEQEV